jgi:hypothetical protein
VDAFGLRGRSIGGAYEGTGLTDPGLGPKASVEKSEARHQPTGYRRPGDRYSISLRPHIRHERSLCPCHVEPVHPVQS